MSTQPLPAAEYRKFLRPQNGLSPIERGASSFLIVDENEDRAELLKRALKENQFPHLSSVRSVEVALSQLKSRSFSHIIFSPEMKQPTISATDFLAQAKRVEEAAFFIVLAAAPEADSIFRFLQLGAHGFLLDPFSSETVIDVIVEATKGEPFSSTLLHAKDRNTVFSALVAKNLDRVAEAKRRASPQIEEESERLRRSVQSARLFSQGGERELLTSFVSFFSHLASGPATSLGRLRAKLREKRKRGSD
jgi:response regulator RpfG family c-di-GMP phosphodiesterase